MAELTAEELRAKRARFRRVTPEPAPDPEAPAAEAPEGMTAAEALAAIAELEVRADRLIAQKEYDMEAKIATKPEPFEISPEELALIQERRKTAVPPVRLSSLTAQFVNGLSAVERQRLLDRVMAGEIE